MQSTSVYFACFKTLQLSLQSVSLCFWFVCLMAFMLCYECDVHSLPARLPASLCVCFLYSCLTDRLVVCSLTCLLDCLLACCASACLGLSVPELTSKNSSLETKCRKVPVHGCEGVISKIILGWCKKVMLIMQSTCRGKAAEFCSLLSCARACLSLASDSAWTCHASIFDKFNVPKHCEMQTAIDEPRVMNTNDQNLEDKATEQKHAKTSLVWRTEQRSCVKKMWKQMRTVDMLIHLGHPWLLCPCLLLLHLSWLSLILALSWKEMRKNKPQVGLESMILYYPTSNDVQPSSLRELLENSPVTSGRFSGMIFCWVLTSCQDVCISSTLVHQCPSHWLMTSLDSIWYMILLGTTCTAYALLL